MDSPRNSTRWAISSTPTQTNPGAPVQQAPQRVHSNASPSQYQGNSEPAELIARSRSERSLCRLPADTLSSLATRPEPDNPRRTQVEEISCVEDGNMVAGSARGGGDRPFGSFASGGYAAVVTRPTACTAGPGPYIIHDEGAGRTERRVCDDQRGGAGDADTPPDSAE